jgi:hypothetical protein
VALKSKAVPCAIIAQRAINKAVRLYPYRLAAMRQGYVALPFALAQKDETEMGEKERKFA